MTTRTQLVQVQDLGDQADERDLEDFVLWGNQYAAARDLPVRFSSADGASDEALRELGEQVFNAWVAALAGDPELHHEGVVELGLEAGSCLASEAVVLEYMPDWIRASHRSAGPGGMARWPHNGAKRLAIPEWLAEELVDGEWVRVVDGANPRAFARCVAPMAAALAG